MREWGKEDREKPAEVVKEPEFIEKEKAQPEFVEEYTQPKTKKPRTTKGTNYFSMGVLAVVWFMIIKYWISNPGFIGVNLYTIFVALVTWYTLKLLFRASIFKGLV